MAVAVVPYASLFVLPGSLALCAGYFAWKGDTRHARGYGYYAWTSILSLPIGLVILLSSPVAIVLDPDHRTLLGWMTDVWMRSTAAPFFPVSTRGVEHLPPPGTAVIYVPNHNSFLDIFALSFLERPEGSFLERTVGLKYLAKGDIFLIPWVGWLMGLTGQIRLDRNARAEGRDVLGPAREKLRRGVSVVVFAEGTRSRTGGLGDFKAGAFKLAMEEGIPIVPITINGTFALAGKPKADSAGSTLIRADEMSLESGAVEVVVHPAIYPGGRAVEALASEARAAISQALT